MAEPLRRLTEEETDNLRAYWIREAYKALALESHPTNERLCAEALLLFPGAFEEVGGGS